ncbi:hypothetical protein ACFX13_047337 [Malus domestica]
MKALFARVGTPILSRYNVIEEVHEKLTMLLDKLPKLVPKYTRTIKPVGILRGSSCKLLNWLGNRQVVATGEIESTNPEVKVHHMVLDPD